MGLHPSSVRHRAQRLEISPTKNLAYRHTVEHKQRLREKYRAQYPNSKIFVENSTYNRASLKRRIIEDGLIDYVCGICGQLPEWNGMPMMLIIDHINGVNNDNRIDNLRFVCSNCDSQLETYKSRNKK